MLNSDLLSNIVDGTLQLQLGQQQFTSVSTDSREIEAGALFVPLIAARNGHDFLHTAIKKRGDRGAVAKGAAVTARASGQCSALFC